MFKTLIDTMEREVLNHGDMLTYQLTTVLKLYEKLEQENSDLRTENEALKRQNAIYKMKLKKQPTFDSSDLLMMKKFSQSTLSIDCGLGFGFKSSKEKKRERKRIKAMDWLDLSVGSSKLMNDSGSKLKKSLSKSSISSKQSIKRMKKPIKLFSPPPAINTVTLAEVKAATQRCSSPSNESEASSASSRSMKTISKMRTRSLDIQDNPKQCLSPVMELSATNGNRRSKSPTPRLEVIKEVGPKVIQVKYKTTKTDTPSWVSATAAKSSTATTTTANSLTATKALLKLAVNKEKARPECVSPMNDDDMKFLMQPVFGSQEKDKAKNPLVRNKTKSLDFVNGSSKEDLEFLMRPVFSKQEQVQSRDMNGHANGSTKNAKDVDIDFLKKPIQSVNVKSDKSTSELATLTNDEINEVLSFFESLENEKPKRKISSPASISSQKLSAEINRLTRQKAVDDLSKSENNSKKVTNGYSPKPSRKKLSSKSLIIPRVQQPDFNLSKPRMVRTPNCHSPDILSPTSKTPMEPPMPSFLSQETGKSRITGYVKTFKDSSSSMSSLSPSPPSGSPASPPPPDTVQVLYRGKVIAMTKKPGGGGIVDAKTSSVNIDY